MCYNTDMKKRVKKQQNMSLQVVMIGLLLLGVLVANALLEKVTVVDYPAITEQNKKQFSNSNQMKP